MNNIAKFFIGLIVCMSTIIFALSIVLIADHENWSQVALEQQNKNNIIEKENNDLRDVNKTLTDELAKLKADYPPLVAKFKADVDQLKSKNDVVFKDFTKNEQELQKTVETMTANDWTSNEFRTTIQNLSSDLTEAQNKRAIYLHFLAQRIVDKNVQASVINEIETSNKQLVNEYADARTVLDKFGLSENLADFPTEPRYPVSGLINLLKKENGNEVQITIGSSDGLEPGHILFVYRGLSFLGRIKVLTTEPNSAVCRILREYQQGVFLVGDKVSSKIL